ncbi:MAG: porin family protein [Bacteroidetes bacterium]|nr:porin family protein [Bacteroidota bacterium]
MKKILLLSTLLLAIFSANAQMEYKRFSLDLNGGLPFFYGDINTKIGGFNVSGRLNYNLTRSFSIGAEYSYGDVSGFNDDAEEFAFRNKYMKAMIGAHFYFFNPFHFHELCSWFQPYAGFNMGMVKSDIESSSSIYGINEEHFNDWVYGSQWTLGVKFKVSKFMDINALYSIVNMKSDKFDNHVPQYFVNNYNDVLTTAELGITLHLGGKGKEPIIWSTPPCCYEGPTDELDSLEAKINELAEAMEEMQEEVDSVQETNDALNNRVDALENKLLSIEECCSNAAKAAEAINSGNFTNNNGNNNDPNYNGGGPDGYLYEADLEGPIEADYYIISGSYAIPTNATNRVKVLAELGYEAIIMKEPSLGLNRVVVDYTDDYNEAILKVAKYRFDLDPKAWIVKKRKK